MSRLDSGQSLPVDLDRIDEVTARNRTARRILVEFQYLGADVRWHEIRSIRLDGNGAVTVRRADLWIQGMGADSQVRVGIAGEESGEDADITFRR